MTPTSAPPPPASTAAPRSPARRNMPASSTLPAGLAHGSVVTSTIAKGRIARIDTSEALRVGRRDRRAHAREPATDGRHRQAPTRTTWPRKGSPFRPLYDDRIRFSGQPIALVVAEEPETARFAASLVRVDYDEEAHVTDMYRQRDEAFALRTPADPAEATFAPPSRAATAATGVRRGRGAPPGRILRPDRASQSDGAVRLDGDLGRRRQAHGLRQDPGRAERAALSVRRLRDASRTMCASCRPLWAARSAPGCGRSIRWSWPCWRRAR